MSKKKIVYGIAWSFTDNILQQLINFIVGIILARILIPSEFGTLGIISIFIAISNTFVNMGLSDALINKKETTERDYSTVFYANIIFGILVYIILFFLAPFISSFFNIDSLTILIRFTGISIILVSISSIQRTLLTKNLEFRIIAIVSLISVFISGCIAIYMALNNYGIVSLVVRMVLGQFCTTILFWVLHKWRPKFIFDINSFIQLWKYGINLFSARILDTIYDNLYYIIIGKFFTASALGYYTRAETFKNILSNNISSTLQRVSFSALSAERGLTSFSSLFSLLFEGLCFLLIFTMTILFTCSSEIILVLIGDKWETSITYLRILVIAGFFTPLALYNLNLLAINAKTNLYFRISVLLKLLSIPTVIIGILMGLNNMLISAAFISIITYLFSIYIVKKEGLQINYQLILICKSMLLGGISYIMISIFRLIELPNIYFQLFIYSTALCLIFLFSSYYFYPQVYKIIKSRIKWKIQK